AAAFITLVQLNPSLVPAWIAVIVIGREFLVSGLRSIAASEGFTIEASELGKFKMVVQIVSVVAVILDHRWKEWPVYGNFIFPVHWIAYAGIPLVVFPEVSRQEFSPEERTLLLLLAHDSISSALQDRDPSLDPPTPHLAEPRGTFTSLYLLGELRGCVGYI